MWKAPERSEWNGEIQGYYVGYKQSSSTENKFVFETVEFSKEEGKEHYLEIFNLKYVELLKTTYYKINLHPFYIQMSLETENYLENFFNFIRKCIITIIRLERSKK